MASTINGLRLPSVSDWTMPNVANHKRLVISPFPFPWNEIRQGQNAPRCLLFVNSLQQLQEKVAHYRTSFRYADKSMKSCSENLGITARTSTQNRKRRLISEPPFCI